MDEAGKEGRRLLVVGAAGVPAGVVEGLGRLGVATVYEAAGREGARRRTL